MRASLVVEDSAILKFVNVRAEQRCSPETLDRGLPAAADDSDNRRVRCICSLLALRDCLSSTGWLLLRNLFACSLSGLHPSCAHFNPLNLELNPICYLLALLAHHFLHVSTLAR